MTDVVTLQQMICCPIKQCHPQVYAQMVKQLPANLSQTSKRPYKQTVKGFWRVFTFEVTIFVNSLPRHKDPTYGMYLMTTRIVLKLTDIWTVKEIIFWDVEVEACSMSTDFCSLEPVILSSCCSARTSPPYILIAQWDKKESWMCGAVVVFTQPQSRLACWLWHISASGPGRELWTLSQTWAAVRHRQFISGAFREKKKKKNHPFLPVSTPLACVYILWCRLLGDLVSVRHTPSPTGPEPSPPPPAADTDLLCGQ